MLYYIECFESGLACFKSYASFSYTHTTDGDELVAEESALRPQWKKAPFTKIGNSNFGNTQQIAKSIAASSSSKVVPEPGKFCRGGVWTFFFREWYILVNQVTIMYLLLFSQPFNLLLVHRDYRPLLVQLVNFCVR